MKITLLSLAFSGYLLAMAAAPAVGQRALDVPTDQINENALYLEMRKKLPTAEVNGALITHGRVEDMMRTMRRQDFFSVHRKYDDMRPAAFRLFVRDQAIDEEIALQEARKMGIGLAQGEAEAIADQFLPNDPEEANRRMEEHGILNQQMLLDRSARNAIIDKLMLRVTADLPEPSTEEMRAFYEANIQVFEVTPERVLARKITLVKPEDTKVGSIEYDRIVERADRLIERLKKGEDFGALADRTTEDPAGIGKGGSLGWVTAAQIPPDFVKPLFSQRVGEIPDKSFESGAGFHILYVQDKSPAVLVPFEEAIPRIKRGINVNRFKEWLAQKRKDATIEYFEELPMTEVLKGGYPKKTDLPF